ncbi:Elongation of very long chain fatty acids protein [Meloidogyne graminicola]|uniref:Elongation of very long chain fatty acids protein n=1 Tax=Meloidogyne graminicola TaxID=189291 RepID=A0A8S9ZMQ5_9BILA|nr:Elongation of very long chain fatty acids protein [Meloidogyne graminicola]
MSSTPSNSPPPQTFLSVSLSQPFDFEGAKLYTQSVQWAGIWVASLYVVAIFGIQWFMKDRKPLQITLSLQLWNAWLALFSIIGSIVTSFGLIREIFFENGLVASYTKIGSFFEGTVGLWTFWFCISKFAELGDTIFIVLRKRPLIFLHWYHHVATLNYGLISYVDNTAFNSWIVWLNFSVHAVMYSYYFLAACRIRLPAWFAQCLTSAQITQFLITLAILAHVGIKMIYGQNVDTTFTSYIYCLLMEISYVALFGNFFYHSYIRGGGKKFNREKQKPEQISMKNGTATKME